MKEMGTKVKARASQDVNVQWSQKGSDGLVRGDDDTQSPAIPANTNPARDQEVPHNPLRRVG